jgi:hypothetical protein
MPVGTTDPRASLTFKPAADAYVNSAAPSTNYGGSQQLRFDASLASRETGANAPQLIVTTR